MQDDKIKQKTVVTEAMHRIKVMIESNKYNVGDKIPTEAQLAEMFGIGRSSIREAIKVFQYLGILETQVPKGTFISPSSNIAAEFFTWFSVLEKKYVFEILEMREVFEQKGIYNLTEDFNNEKKSAFETLEALKDLLEELKKAVRAKDYERLTEIDFNFHRMLIDYSHNTLFLSIYDHLKSFTTTEMHETHKTYTDLSKLITIHKQILEAILTHDNELAIRFHASHFPLIKDNLRNS